MIQTRNPGTGLRSAPCCCVAVLVVAAMVPAQQPGPPDVGTAIDRGVAWLLSIQEPDGSFRGEEHLVYSGMTSFALYTLMKCGVEHDHPAVRAGLAWVAQQKFTRTYDLGMTLMMYQALGDSRPAAAVKALADRIVKTAANGEPKARAEWGYPGNHDGGDPMWTDLSNTQYALLGLRAARLSGYGAGSATFWNAILDGLLDRQDVYGGFGYRKGESDSASMTVAGATCLVICGEALGLKPDSLVRRRIDARVVLAIKWLDDHWSVDHMVDMRMPKHENDRWLLYYLYGLERIGAFADFSKVGAHDWYAEGAAHLVKKQASDGSWGQDDDTCFALLFLRRGSRSTGLTPRVVAPVPERDTEQPWHREAMRDAGRNLLRGNATATATSHLEASALPEFAIDGRGCTMWVSGRDDTERTLKIELRKIVPANAIKFTPAAPYAWPDIHYAAPRDIEVRLNDDAPIRVRLDESPGRKQRLMFPQKVVKTIRIKIVSVNPGTSEKSASGFREIELMAGERGDDPDALPVRVPGSVVMERAVAGVDAWRFTTTPPPAEWAGPEFDAGTFAAGVGAFTTNPEESPWAAVTTPWKTPDLWAVRTFSWSGAVSDGLMLELNYDDDVEVWVNGVPAAAVRGYSHGRYRAVTISAAAKAALKPGDNRLAVHVHNASGFGFFDMGAIRMVPWKP